MTGIGTLVYIARCANALPAGLEQEYLAMMPAWFRPSILRYRRRLDRQATLFGRLLLLRALRTIHHDAGTEKFLSLRLTRYGRPFIPGGPEFNISHCEELVVLAVTENGAVGIDIEKIRPVDLDDFTSHLPEVAELRAGYEDDQIYRRFFQCWTRKEAVVKGCGMGLSAPLEQVVMGEGTALFRGTTWFLIELPVDGDYCCHLAVDRPPGRVSVEWVDLMDGLF